jgi:hypothetical protein
MFGPKLSKINARGRRRRLETQTGSVGRAKIGKAVIADEMAGRDLAGKGPAKRAEPISCYNHRSMCRGRISREKPPVAACAPSRGSDQG